MKANTGERTMAKKDDTVRVRVTSEKVAEQLLPSGKLVTATVPWKNEVHNNHVVYKSGDEFDLPNDEALLRLLEMGVIQRASEPPKPYRAASIEGDRINVNSVRRRSEVEGKVPTRTGPGPNAGYQEDIDDEL
jgi:hypothetical protein